jgi:Domain of unknown function (DUF4432)
MMAKLYGREWTRAQIEEMTGDLSQVAGVRFGELSDGFERGVRVAECRTGGGLSFTVVLDRGMDVGAAEYQGIPLAWLSGAGFPHPAFHEREGREWVRTFGGGLVTGCGLTNAGGPTEDEFGKEGLHGRLNHIPARDVSSGGEWEGDEYRFQLQGRMRQYAVFGENMELTRVISWRLGDAALVIEDTVENRAERAWPLMLLYHVNVGFPILGPDSEIETVAHDVTPRDEEASNGVSDWMRLKAPEAGFAEQVFLHDIPAGVDGMAEATLFNRKLKLGVRVRFRKAELPFMAEWKMTGKGTYVVGFEPANAFVLGRAAERAAGRLQMLEAGERRSFRVEVSVEDRR